MSVRIMLGDLSYLNDWTHAVQFVPLNIGYLAAFLRNTFGPEICVSLHKDPHELLSMADACQPHMVGLSTYFWNTDLNRAVVKNLRARCGSAPVIVLGGPSVDTDEFEQSKLFSRIPGIDCLVPLEGELGFSNLVGRFLSDPSHVWDSPIDGVVFRSNGDLITGAACQPLDLSLLPSAYLSGIMTSFMKPPYRPLIQTSRGCPYTCRFCVSGKTRSKPRVFPLDVVKEEITFIASKYSDCPHIPLFICDENFGLFNTDVETAEYLRAVSTTSGYPKSLFFYIDKKFTSNTKLIMEHLADMNQIGLMLALQSENPQTLRAIGRKNLTEAQLEAAIQWAAARGIETGTELIFGLPNETKDTFVAQLDRAVSRGFDTILCHNLFIMDGILLNRLSDRANFNLKTKFRLQGPNYEDIAGDFAVEVEEVVVGSDSFDFRDYLTIRSLNFMFYAVYALRFYRWCFNAAASRGYPLTRIFELFMAPDRLVDASAKHINFVEDLLAAFQAELYEDSQTLRQAVQQQYKDAGSRVVAPTRLNVFYGARLIYQERDWVGDALRLVLRSIAEELGLVYAESFFEPLLTLCDRERFDPGMLQYPAPMMVEYDLIKWRETKFRQSLDDFRLASPQEIVFGMSQEIAGQLQAFNSQYGNLDRPAYYYTALDTLVPRSRLLFDLVFKGIA